MSRALLPPKVASDLARIYLAKGVQATVAIEGNTLTEEEVLAQIDDKLELPASKEYLGREVGNVVDAANEIVTRIHSGNAPRLAAAFVADCNGRILKGLAEVLGDEVEPGRIRKHSVGVGRYRGAPAEDCEYLLDQLGEWLEEIPQLTVLATESDNRVATGVLAGRTGPSLHCLDSPFRGWQRKNRPARGAVPAGARPAVSIGATSEQPLQRHPRCLLPRTRPRQPGEPAARRSDRLPALRPSGTLRRTTGAVQGGDPRSITRSPGGTLCIAGSMTKRRPRR